MTTAGERISTERDVVIFLTRTLSDRAPAMGAIDLGDMSQPRVGAASGVSVPSRDTQAPDGAPEKPSQRVSASARLARSRTPSLVYTR
jgi:hypothetical protein